MTQKNTQKQQATWCRGWGQLLGGCHSNLHLCLLCKQEPDSLGQGWKTAWPMREDWCQVQLPTPSTMMLCCSMLSLVKLEASVPDYSSPHGLGVSWPQVTLGLRSGKPRATHISGGQWRRSLLSLGRCSATPGYHQTSTASP